MSKSKPVVYVLDPYYPDAIDLIRNSSTVEAVLPPESRRLDWHENADAIMIRSETRITADELQKAKRLKLVVKQGVGVDNIDLEAAKWYGVAICNTPALNSETVAELTIALAIAVSRRICEIDVRIRRGEKIVRSEVLGRSLFKKCVGIVGMGNVGKEVAKKWIAAMEGNIVAYDLYAPENAWTNLQHRRVNQLEDLLRVADVVTLHVPLTSVTKGMIGEKEIGLMKKEAILLNCARGGVVDEKALLEALRSKQIFGAGLDAMDVEPPTMDAYGETLLACENVIMTPHIGGSTLENQIRSGKAAVETVLNFLEGKEVLGRLV